MLMMKTMIDCRQVHFRPAISIISLPARPPPISRPSPGRRHAPPAAPTSPPPLWSVLHTTYTTMQYSHPRAPEMFINDDRAPRAVKGRDARPPDLCIIRSLRLPPMQISGARLKIDCALQRLLVRWTYKSAAGTVA